MPRATLPLGAARFALFAAFALLTLVQPAVSSRQADEAAAEAHRLRHRYPQHGLCSRCPPGFGVARRCTPVRDTVCRSCPPGYYAPGYSRKHSCWPCSRCGDGLYEARPCTGTSDTICDACGARDHGHADGRQCRHSSDGPARQRHGDHRRADISTDPPPTPRRPDGDAGAPESLAAPSSLSSSYSFVDNDDDVAIGVTQIVAFQIVLIFTAVAAILALTCRLRVFINHETTFKIPESYRREDGISLIEHLSETS